MNGKLMSITQLKEVMRVFFEEDTVERDNFQNLSRNLLIELGRNLTTLSEELKSLHEELNDLKARMPAEDPCDIDLMKDISS